MGELAVYQYILFFFSRNHACCAQVPHAPDVMPQKFGMHLVVIVTCSVIRVVSWKGVPTRHPIYLVKSMLRFLTFFFFPSVL